ncbi:methyltransferase-like protein 17, mitochondrial isoform X2 [Electrophorus electricus]|uniref:methyltransferase-like protein 17, mitochondrial isoform X2 n=1 Tax=Electrophorus electricus TaxID=8005 RepID=UPI0015CFEBEF|nr:methyltransferase-like protein 17, mitochondrial isoform X2 [Electrophorus electricus]
MSYVHNRLYDVCSRCRAGFPLRVTRWCASTASDVALPDFLKGAPHRKHPGVTHLKTLCLPEGLQRGALSLIHKSEVKDLTERAGRLTNFLWSRKRAAEASQLRERAIALEKKWMWNEKEQQRDTDKHSFEAQIRKKVLTEMRRTTYHWTPLRYDEELGVVYMAARLAGGYAAVLRALNEIKKRDLAFTPYSLLDFGSGLGTALWASHTLWGVSLKEYVCVDSCGAMNTLAEQLLTGGIEAGEPLIKHVYFRQFFPVSPKVQADLVVAAFSLSEMATQHDRQETVLTLWRKTSSYLVLVENGTKEGHQILMEARDVLLKSEEKVTPDSRRSRTFAPCTHEMPCPKLLSQKVVPCNFIQSYYPLPLRGNPEREQEKFSYLIMSRVKQKSVGQVDWARLTGPVHRRSRHVQCQVCCSNGELRQFAVTKRRHGRHMYRCARSCDWGDQLPVIQAEENNPTDETHDSYAGTDTMV